MCKITMSENSTESCPKIDECLQDSSSSINFPPRSDTSSGYGSSSLSLTDSSSAINIPPRSDTSSGYGSSSPRPTPSSSPSRSPEHTLKRSRTSSFRLINRRMSVTSTSSHLSLPVEPNDRLVDIIGWYPAFLLRIYLELFSLFFVVIFKRLPIIIPTLWISAWMWVISKIVLAMLSVVKDVLVILLSTTAKRIGQKRTILISGGSSVQALHLARNFASAGARVIMCEVEGHSKLGHFSTCVHRYYTVPKPVEGALDRYLDALKLIVTEEGAKYYIPVSESTPAYFDALVKPHLESLGCECICPELREVLLLDDTTEFMRKVQGEGLPTPNIYPVTNNLDLNRLYDFRIVKKEKHFMVSTGLEGCKNKMKMELPRSRKHLKSTPMINEQNPWLVIQDYEGEQYVTCTTIKDSQVVCNVTCRLNELNGLVPVEKPEIEQWLRQFFAGLKAHRKIIGHFSFYFTVVAETDTLLPMDCQIGVRLPYICYTSVQSRMVWKPCKHFSRSASGPIVNDNGKHWLNEIAKNTFEHPTVSRVLEFLPILWGKNDALFVWWDPLPYYAYYYVILPVNKISNLLTRLNSL